MVRRETADGHIIPRNSTPDTFGVGGVVVVGGGIIEANKIARYEQKGRGWFALKLRGVGVVGVS